MARLRHFRLAISALLIAALSGTVLAPYTIKGASDVDKIKSCRTISRNIIITGLQGVIELANVETISGNVLVNLTQAKGGRVNPGGLKSKSLKDITGKLEITGPQQKNAAATSGFSFDLPALERIGNVSVTGSLLFNDGDMLHTFNSPRASVSNFIISGLRGDFVSDIKTIPTELRAAGADNLLTVSLPSLDSLGALILTNNPRLTSISSTLTTAQRIEIHSTGRASKLLLPNLATLGNTTTSPSSSTRPATLLLRDLADIQLPALRATHPSASSSGGIDITLGAFRDLALPALESIAAGGLRIASNTILDAVALPRLASVGGRLNVTDNENLVEFKANALKTVESVRLEGNFTKVEMFGLEAIANGFYLAGDKTMDCSWFDEHLPGGVLKGGSYECKGNHTRPEKAREPEGGDKGVVAPVKEEEGGLTGKAKVGLGVGLGVLAAVVGLGAWAWWKRRRQIQYEKEREVAIGLESRGEAGLGYRGGGYNPLGGGEMRDVRWGSGSFAVVPPTPSSRISEMDGLLPPRRELAG
ncbi:hypothetical protein B0T18DRAFT_450044 [Schizothecium vesticola]|uniref:Uncharacterized protein n=1 Tax=Schizothecium vesticola TaxID=314040 RepID=A0AA40EGS6_9PEZI|nr:hypothetical protein B0T18DRAFT_450044 [Schizothecium vesticola]